MATESTVTGTLPAQIKGSQNISGLCGFQCVYSSGQFICECSYSVPDTKPDIFWYHLWEGLHPSGIKPHDPSLCPKICLKVYILMKRLLAQRAKEKPDLFKMASMSSSNSKAALQTLDNCLPLKCDKCSFTSVFRTIHEPVHQVKQDTTKQLWCPHCPFSCDSRQHFTIHCFLHPENRENCTIRLRTCEYCHASFTDNDQFEDHQEEKHKSQLKGNNTFAYKRENLGIDQLKCIECDVTVPAEIAYLKHLEDNHAVSVTEEYFSVMYSSHLKISAMEINPSGEVERASSTVFPTLLRCKVIFLEDEVVASQYGNHESRLYVEQRAISDQVLNNQGKPVSCDSCTFTSEFATIRAIHGLVHGVKQDKTGRFCCKHCPYSCDMVRNFQRHASCHIEYQQGKSKIREYICGHADCGLSFSEEDAVDEHHDKIHLDPMLEPKIKRWLLTDIPCQQCDQTFNDEKSLVEHFHIQQTPCSLTKYLKGMYGISAIDTLQEKQGGGSEDNGGGSLGFHSKYVIIEVVKDEALTQGGHEVMKKTLSSKPIEHAAAKMESTPEDAQSAQSASNVDLSSDKEMENDEGNFNELPTTVPKIVTKACDHTKVAKYKMKPPQLKGLKKTIREKTAGHTPSQPGKQRKRLLKSSQDFETVLQCKTCKHTTPSTAVSRMRKHVQSHLNYRPYQCSHCKDFHGVEPSDVKKHNSTKHPGKEFSITTNTDIKIENSLKKYYTMKRKPKTHVGTGSTKVKEVRKPKKLKDSSNSEGLSRPTSSITQQKPKGKKLIDTSGGSSQATVLKCKECNHTTPTTTPSRMRKHVMTHGDYKPWKCNLCGFGAIEKQGLNHHFRSKHPDKKHDVTEKRDPAQENSLKALYAEVPKEPMDTMSSPLSSPGAAGNTTSSLSGETDHESRAKKPKLGVSTPQSDTVRQVNPRPPIPGPSCSSTPDSSLHPKSSIALRQDVPDAEMHDDKALDDSKMPSSTSESGPTLYCKKCNYSTPNGRARMLNHVIAKHTTFKLYECPHCSFKGNQSSNVKKHIKAKHPGMLETVIAKREPVIEESLESQWEQRA